MSESLRQRILSLLAESDTYISGQEISERVGISRTGVWKHIQVLREKGYIIDSVSNQGYQLLQPPKGMVPEEITRLLKTRILGKTIIFYHEVDSTNTQAKLQANEHPEGALFLAEAQVGGRGRLGRNWSSEPGQGIWCSVLLKPDVRPSIAGQFPLLTAVAIAEVLHELGVDARIKWPNDLLIEGKKVCGILTEMSAELDRINFLVIGFGLNVKHHTDDFPPDVRPIATSLEMVLGREVDRTQLLVKILEQLEWRYTQFLEVGFEPIRQVWKAHTCTLGHETKISRWNQPPLYGYALDIASDGSLIVELPDGQVLSVISGEIPLS